MKKMWRRMTLLAMCAGGLGGLLLAGMPGRAGLSAEEKAKPAANSALPPDLSAVPADAVFFVSVRAADFWNSGAAKGAREHLTRTIPDALEHFEKEAGVAPEDIERLTGIMLELAPREGPMIFIATNKPYDRAKVLQRVAPGALEEKRKGHTLYVSKEGHAVHFLNEQVYQVGPPNVLRSYLERPVAKQKEGPLSAALRLAGEKHTLTGAVNFALIADKVGDNVPPQAEPFKPLLKARVATLTIDLGEETRLRARTQFPKEGDAKEGETAAKAGLQMMEAGLGQGLQQMAREPGTAKLVELLKGMQTGLKAASVTQKGSSLDVAFSFKTDLATASASTLEAIQKVRTAAARMQDANNLKQIAIAMHNYHATHGTFPPQAVYSKEGKALLSWRVLLLPYLEQDALYKEFHLDEPWDSEHNKKLLSRMPKLFINPAAKPADTQTSYQAFAGKGAFFEGMTGLRIADISDGTSNTIMVAEAAKSVPWSKPEDLSFDPDKPLPKLGGVFPGGFNVSMCDGSVRFISDKISVETLKAAITRNGGEVLGSDF